MIDTFSRKITHLIKENVNDITPEKEEIIEYGLKLAVYEVVLTFFVFGVALFLGIFKYFLLAFAIYGLLRLVEGGAHMNSRIKCLVTYSITMFGSVYIAKNIYVSSPLYCIPVFVLNFYMAYKYAPGDTLEKPILRKKIRFRLKLITLILVTLLFITAFFAWYFDPVYFNIILFATLLVTFFLSPIGYRFSGCKRATL